MNHTQSIFLNTLRFHPVIVATMLSPIFFLLVSCSTGIEDVSNNPAPQAPEDRTPTVEAALSEELKSAISKYTQAQAILTLDSTEYEMTINNGVATWQQEDLPVMSPYSVTVRIELALDSQPDTPLMLAQATVSSHDFNQQATKSFDQAAFVFEEFDDDKDGQHNLAEILVGGNPYSEAPTITSAAQITVLEQSITVMNVTAVSPRANPVWSYKILADYNGDLFSIDAAGALSFKNPVLFDITPPINNDYTVTVEVGDASFTSRQTLTVSLTDVFELNITLGLKQMKFNWFAQPGASYYKILQSTDGWATFSELPNGGYLTGMNFNRPLAVHKFDQAKTQFKLQAYNNNDSKLIESDPVSITGNLAGAIGYVKSIQTVGTEWFGSSVAISADGNTLAVGAPVENSATGAIRVYRRAVGTWQSQSMITAPNGGRGDRFGAELALSADGNTLAVGAYWEDSAARGLSASPALPDDDNAVDAGAVYVYDRAGNAEVFSLRAYVKAPNSSAYDYFGSVVALSADGATLAVGAYLEDSAAQGIGGNQQNDCENAGSTTNPKPQNCAANSGSVYLFEWTRDVSGVWGTGKFIAYVKAPNSEVGDWFGAAVALSADGATLAIGAMREDSAAQGIGGNQQNDCANVDGSVNLAPQNCAASSGAVYLFERAQGDDNTAWDVGDLAVYVKGPNNSGSSAKFGVAVALSADGKVLAVGAYDEASAARGINDFVVGQDDKSAYGAGAVYLFERMQGDDNTVWDSGDFTAYVKASNSEAGDWFGRAVALSADGATLAVGAYREDSAAQGIGGDQQDDCFNTDGSPNSDAKNCADVSGAVYLYERARNGDGTWLTSKFIAYVKAPNSETLDMFGASVALSADGATLAVGAKYEDSAAQGIGGNQQDDCKTANGSLNPDSKNCAIDSGAVYLY